MPTRLEHLGLGRHRPEVRFSTRLVPPGLWITPWIARPARLAVLIVPLSPGGQDNVQGDGGATDYIEVESGNGENGRGGEGVSDIVKVWGDSGTDNAYGGAQENDYCYVDVPPGGDDNWDNTCEQVRKQ